MKPPQHYIRDRTTLLFVYFFFYYAVFFFLYLDHRLLSQYQPVFFNYNRDLTELALIGTGLPRWLIAHPRAFLPADLLAFLLPVGLLAYAARKDRLSPTLGILFGGYLALYLLLADIFWQVHHEPFILYLLLSGAWMTNRPQRFYALLRICRYYFLYIFVSAAVWKIARGGLFSGGEMSRILLVQHSDLLSGRCRGLACRIYGYLVAHPGLSWWLYFGAVALEAFFIVGFFTRRRDHLLIILAAVFVLADLLLMRIPYWTLLLGTVTLWLPPPAGPAISSSGQPREKKILLYETTHHENLPALLDLSEARFSQVTVFLKEQSYHQLHGQGSPEQRWPRTDFFIQTADCSNRRFIGQLFTFLHRHGYTHLHLATLDNNLLLFALRLTGIGPVHVSLTVHEVNEYFGFSFRTLRDWTESAAKYWLHRQIGHYHVFLPAMAEKLRQRRPGATAVFIPSRFYEGHHPPVEGHHPPAVDATTSTPPAPGIPPSGVTPFIIVLPGSPDPNRRNYPDVIATIRLLRTRTDRPIDLVLLGDSSTGAGTQIRSQLQSLESPGLRLHFFNGYIPQSVYEPELADAHLVWSPLNLHKRSSRHSPETYGLTTASGLTADLLLGNIPALAPEGFIVPDIFKSAIFTYTSPEEAAALITRMMEDAEYYRTIREKIHAAFGRITKENFSAAFDALAG